MKVLLTGGTEFIGRWMVHKLALNRYRVRVMARDLDRARTVCPLAAEITGGDLTLPYTLESAVRDVEAVVHCAGLVGSAQGAREAYF